MSATLPQPGIIPRGPKLDRNRVGDPVTVASSTPMCGLATGCQDCRRIPSQSARLRAAME
eukprot:355371-Chlamydomonas_euryale.AAC.9